MCEGNNLLPNEKGCRNGVVTLTVITIITPNGYIHIQSSTSLQHLRGGAHRTSDVDVIIGCKEIIVHGTMYADVTIGCYYGDYSSCDNTIPMSLFIWKKFSPHTCLPPFFNYYSYSYHIFF